MKLFITSKVYDTEKQTIAEIEKAVHAYSGGYPFSISGDIRSVPS